MFRQCMYDMFRQCIYDMFRQCIYGMFRQCIYDMFRQCIYDMFRQCRCIVSHFIHYLLNLPHPKTINDLNNRRDKL